MIEINNEIKVLDNGFIRLVDSMGNDDRIVQSARVSYGKGTKTKREDEALIDYLMKNDHTTPFEQVEFTFHVKAPIFIARQWFRHRMASYNEISGRYSEMKNEYYIPDFHRLQKQSKNNKQGSSNEELTVEEKNKYYEEYTNIMMESFELYEKMLNIGLSREIARIHLPLSLYTEFYFKIDLKNLLHFIKLRSDNHAQYEIREYSNAILKIIEKITPIAIESFKKHKIK